VFTKHLFVNYVHYLTSFGIQKKIDERKIVVEVNGIIVLE
jgi:hypothetical protein